MLALAHDYRVQSSERGFLCLNEIDHRMPLTPFINAVVISKLEGNTLRNAILQVRLTINRLLGAYILQISQLYYYLICCNSIRFFTYLLYSGN